MMGRAPQELRAGPEGLEPLQVGFILPAISRTEHFSPLIKACTAGGWILSTEGKVFAFQVVTQA